MARKKKEDNLEELEDSSEKKKKSFLSFGSEKESTKEQRLWILCCFLYNSCIYDSWRKNYFK